MNAEMLNRWLRKGVRWYICSAYRRKMRLLRRASPGRFRPGDPAVERRHRELWGRLGARVDVSWCRFYRGVSGIDDARYVPEDFYYAIIERVLNDFEYAWVVADKGTYGQHVDAELLPRTVLKSVSGRLVSGVSDVLTIEEAETLWSDVEHDVVVKPSIGSCGGTNVRRYRCVHGRLSDGSGNPVSMRNLVAVYGEHFLVQEALDQAEVLARFHRNSVNTIRLMTYRSVTDDRIHVLKSILRMGTGAAIVDNEASGGISVGLSGDGVLNPYACSRDGTKFDRHPDSGVSFEGVSVPSFPAVVSAAREAAGRIHSQRLLSFDMAVTSSGEVRLIEINTFGQAINFHQTHTGGLFGDLTEEIVGYCEMNLERDTFRVVRVSG